MAGENEGGRFQGRSSFSTMSGEKHEGQPNDHPLAKAFLGGRRTAWLPARNGRQIAMPTGYELIEEQVQTHALGAEVPVVGWFHFPLADPVTENFIAETYDKAEENHWDFIKIMTNGNYMPIAYGADYDWSIDPTSWDGPFFTHPIESAEDAANLPALDARKGILAREVRIARAIKEHYAGVKPVIATLFDPLSWVQELTTPMDPRGVLALLETDPDALEGAVKAIAQTNRNFLERLITEAHVDGVFFATKFSRNAILTDAQHDRFVMPYIQQVNDQLAGRTWFNLLHIHGDSQLRFDDLLQFDSFNALNWESEAPVNGAHSIAEVRAKTDKVLVAGIDQHHDFLLSRREVKSKIARRLERALEQNAGGPFIFGPGCSMPLYVEGSRFNGIYGAAHEAGLRG